MPEPTGDNVDVLDIIKQEHREVGSLIDEVNTLEAGDERVREIAHEIMEKLSMHLSIEERLFYAKLKERSEEDEQLVDVLEGYTEHAVAQKLMEMLKAGRRNDEKFKAELQVLGESVKHHVEEEESTIFHLAKEFIDSEEREKIGESWEKAKQRATNGSTSKKKTTAKVKTVRGSVSKSSRSRTRR